MANDLARVELNRFLQELKEEYLPWYEKQVNFWKNMVVPIQTIMLAAGFLPAILAVWVGDEKFKNEEWVRISMVLIPAIGTGLTAVVAQGKLYERLQLREHGRFTIQSIYNEGKQKIAAAKTEEECTALQDVLRRRVDEVETRQAEAMFKFWGVDQAKDQKES